MPRITKLPDRIDPAYLIEEKIKKQNDACPFCGSTEKWIPTCKRWYGKRNPYSWQIFGEKHHWKILGFKCKNCGAEWETDPFPTDIDGLDYE